MAAHGPELGGHIEAMVEIVKAAIVLRWTRVYNRNGDGCNKFTSGR
jgi:hypothetical protein